MLSRRQALLGSVAHGGMISALTGKAGALKTMFAPGNGGTDAGVRWLLWYDRPAATWTERLPLGNGQFGAMLGGTPDEERLQLNHDTFWAGGPYSSSRPSAHRHLAEVQRLLLANKPLEAQAILETHMMGQPSRQMPYQAMGEIIFKSPALGTCTNYMRSLDLDTATARTRYETADGVCEWRTMISAPADVMIRRLSCSGKARRRLFIGYDRAAGAEILAKSDGTMIVQGANRSAYGVNAALRFCLRIAVIAPGADFEPAPDGLWINNARNVDVLAAAATNFVRFNDVSGDPEARTAALIAKARMQPVDALEAEHVAEHRSYFRSFDLDLGDSERSRWPTDRRVAANELDKDPQLSALVFQYGRYLLIASSRPGTQPSTLQGLWNADDDPIWGSKYTININTQMNYWAAEQVGLQACVEPLVQLVRDLSVTGRQVAIDHWAADGWVAHHNTDLWRAAAPIDRARSGYWPMGGAWLTLHLFERYRYSRDKAYLTSIWPIMKGAAEFFLSSMITDPVSGYLVTAPSLSPENKTPLGTALCFGPMMDTEIIRDLYRSTIDASEALGLESEFRDALTKSLAQLSPLKIGKAGQLQEWLQDWDLEAPDRHHRHISHLYALYPSRQIDPVATPQLAAAARRTLELRGDGKSVVSAANGMGDFAVRYGKATADDQETTGWGLAWRACLWARLRDGARALDSLTKLFGARRLYPNLFALHPPFQIDGNFGAVAAIVEMLVQVVNGRIELLPALPSQWRKGRVNGLRLHGDITLDMMWNDGVVDYLRLTSPIAQQVLVQQGKRSTVVALHEDVAVTLRKAPSRSIWLTSC